MGLIKSHPEKKSQNNNHKHHSGAPFGNQNARKHALSQAKSALKNFGSRAIDKRTAVGRALHEWRQDIERDLGGDISAQQKAVLEIVVRLKLMLDSIDAY